MRSQAEHREQVAVIQWSKLARAMFPGLEYLLAIPNGGVRSAITGARLKAEGVRAGVPDLFLAYPHRGRAGLWIEMKSSKGRVSPEQHQWLLGLQEVGYECSICFSAEEAIEALTRYLQ